MILITPADAFLPNSVPCGPRNTSTRSISTRSSVACPGRAVTTPSITVDTVGSTPGEVVMVPTPRMNSDVSLLEAPVRKLTVGVCVVMAPSVLRLLCSSCSPLSTVMAIGTDCNGSLRLVAVTLMVSSLSDASGFAAAVGACCAWTTPATRAAIVDIAGNNRCRAPKDLFDFLASFMHFSLSISFFERTHCRTCNALAVLMVTDFSLMCPTRSRHCSRDQGYAAKTGVDSAPHPGTSQQTLYAVNKVKSSRSSI